MPKVDFREEVANVALAELLEQRGLSEGRHVANAVDGSFILVMALCWFSLKWKEGVLRW